MKLSELLFILFIIAILPVNLSLYTKTIDFQGVVSDSIDTKGISFATVCLLILLITV